MDCSPPSSSVHGIFQQGYWSGLLFPPPGDLPDPGIEPVSPALVSGFFTTRTSWEAAPVVLFNSVQLLSRVRFFVTPWTPGFPVHHQLLELAQTHVHRVGDAIQPSHPLLTPSPPAFNLSQHQGLFL